MMNSNSKTSVSGDLTSAKLINYAGTRNAKERPLSPLTSLMQFCPSGMWDSDHTKTPFGLEILLINEQGIVIQGFIPPGRIDTYLPHLVAGSIYRLTNFYGCKSKTVYRVAEPNVTVTFSWNSVLSVSADSTAEFPEDRLRFYGHKEFDEA
ncbi:hypothetical protein F2Q68_00033513 [Brassica cretica]|uniref:Uncharacterized protein n=1 Tax=Brassica cretica TaxID=69181 RepID=A0A8S9HA42_BRACR|nr:hypothetical protein F2Q68_00033513 [Brassica cretica]